MARAAHRRMMHALAGIAGLGKTPSSAIPARIQKAYAKSDDTAKAAVQDILKPFMPLPGVDPRDYEKARDVVGKFAVGKEAEFKEIKSTGTVLTVKGVAIASRPSPSAKFMSVCPGKFGTDRMSRTAANAVLDFMRAGIHVEDRDSMAFFSPAVGKGKRMGRVESSQACYNVSIPGDIVRRLVRAEEAYARSPEGQSKAWLEAEARLTEKLMAAEAKLKRKAKKKSAPKKAKKAAKKRK